MQQTLLFTYFFFFPNAGYTQEVKLILTLPVFLFYKSSLWFKNHN